MEAGRGFHEKATSVNRKLSVPEKKGDSQGGLAPLVGEPAFFSGVGGTHPAKRPLGDREGGVTFLFL
jgi:hypothetical protein